MTIQDYIEAINKRFKAGISTEHSYRGDLQSLLKMCGITRESLWLCVRPTGL
ncbi:MAG: hypothetical protein HKK67_04320 [Chlorobiaceae bacterium]|nr:hypothetical protein [Chlorobiaceae bacterium]